MQTVTLQLILITLLILLMTFFTLAEAAVPNVRKSTLQDKATEGDKRASIALSLVESPSVYLSTARDGESLTGFFVVAIGAAAFADPLRDNMTGGRSDFLTSNAWAIAVQ